MGFVLSFTKIMDQQLGRQVCLTTPEKRKIAGRHLHRQADGRLPDIEGARMVRRGFFGQKGPPAPANCGGGWNGASRKLFDFS
jgi:hypothetical protein